MIPTQTFFNLPLEKQDRIQKAAISEFSNHYFSNANISRIVEKAEIPRGSFYQYFADIMDLYRFLFQQMAKKKQAYLDGVIKEISSTDSFTLIRELYVAGIRFAQKHPELARMGNRFYRESPSFKEEILGEFLPGAETFIANILQQGQKRGEIRLEVDIELAATLLFQLNLAVMDVLTRKSEEWDLFQDNGAFLQTAEKVLDIIEYGIRSLKYVKEEE